MLSQVEVKLFIGTQSQKIEKIIGNICLFKKKAVPLRSRLKESCLSGRKSRTRNAVYA